MDTKFEKPDSEETKATESVTKLSPEEKSRIEKRMQGLSADMAQAEEVERDALNEAGSAMRAGNQGEAENMLNLATEADQAYSSMRLEQMQLQGTLDGEPKEPPAPPPAPAAEQPAYKPGYAAETLPMTEGEPLEEKPTREAPISYEGQSRGIEG